MLVYSYKLEKYIRNQIFPKILLIPNRYVIKGSFRRKIPYVTDIDMVNEVYPEINENNIYEELLKLIDKLSSEKNSNIILVYITCGIDERFKIFDGSDQELDRIKSLLNENDARQFESITKMYADNPDKKLFFVTELIWKFYKLRWKPKNIIDNSMELIGGLKVKFTDIVKKNSSLLLQYYVKVNTYPIGIDVVINYKPVDMTVAYQSAAEYQLRLANYSKEYYYMLFPFKHYFKENKELAQELENLIEKKFGLYKQLMVRIDTYHTLYQTNNLDIKTATDIVVTIIKDVQYLPHFRSNTISKIRDVAEDNTPIDKMRKWSTLLNVLYDEINQDANNAAEDYFFKYLDMVPTNIRKQYYIANIRRKKSGPYSIDNLVE